MYCFISSNRLSNKMNNILNFMNINYKYIVAGRGKVMNIYLFVIGTIIIIICNFADFVNLYKGKETFPFSGYRLNAIFYTFLYAEIFPVMFSIPRDMYFIVTVLFFIVYLVVYLSICYWIQKQVGYKRVKKQSSNKLWDYYMILIFALIITVINPLEIDWDRRSVYLLTAGIMLLIYVIIQKIKKK